MGRCYVVPWNRRELTTLLRAGRGRIYMTAVIGAVARGSVSLVIRSRLLEAPSASGLWWVGSIEPVVTCLIALVHSGIFTWVAGCSGRRVNWSA